MKSFLPVPFFLLFSMNALAQNLVPNGSFEEYWGCPNGISQVDSCKYWYPFGGQYGVLGTPDYFNVCATNPIASVPDNSFGTQEAFEGNAYMGLYTFVNAYYREFIGAQLLDTMQVGKQYAVSMRVSRGNYVPPGFGAGIGAASNKIGIRLTTFGYAPESILPLDNFAQLYEDSIIIDSVNWVLLHWNFIADSAYTNLYIGNFFDINHTDTVHLTNFVDGKAYYFVDSINIGCLDCGANEVESIDDESQLYFDSFNEAIKISISQNAKLSIINAVGEVIYFGEVRKGKSSIPFQTANGVYLIIIQTKEGRMVRKILVH